MPPPELLGIRVEFFLFGLTLLGVALFHRRTVEVAASGLAALAVYCVTFTGLDPVAHLAHEARTLLNLLGILLGFSLLAAHFAASRLPDALPRFLPADWRGGLVLLVCVFVLSSFLDNIAAALVGGMIARSVYRERVHVGYLAGIVAASNAGGTGSVVGDTTTTMIWIAGFPASAVLHAYVGAVPALLVFATVAARQQHRYQPIVAETGERPPIDAGSLVVVAAILAGAILTNATLGLPALGVWIAIAVTLPYRMPSWHEFPAALRSAAFLLSLVLCASLMPVAELPAPSWQTALGLGVVSAVFDNIPLTALALEQGGHDWGVLAYAVGFGGSMLWFGSSAGVALSGLFPQARSTGAWLWHGWHVPVAFAAGFFVLLGLLGWQAGDLPGAPR